VDATQEQKYSRGWGAGSYTLAGSRGRSVRRRGASWHPRRGGAAAPPSSPAACPPRQPLGSTSLSPPAPTLPDTMGAPPPVAWSNNSGGTEGDPAPD